VQGFTIDAKTSRRQHHFEQQFRGDVIGEFGGDETPTVVHFLDGSDKFGPACAFQDVPMGANGQRFWRIIKGR
jgi:hypothetical protein